jgi:hypothetical protein
MDGTEHPDSDTQIPLYHFFMFGWTKIFGTDAVAMRASNVGMLMIANLALVRPFRSRPIIAFAVILTSCLSAPIWYYLNEIRPYIMLYTGACLMVGATIEMIASPHRPSPFGINAFCVGAVVSSGASVLGVAWAASAARFAGKAVTLISAIVMAYSSLSVRYAPRHAKNDYKHAAKMAANRTRP